MSKTDGHIDGVEGVTAIEGYGGIDPGGGGMSGHIKPDGDGGTATCSPIDTSI